MFVDLTGRRFGKLTVIKRVENTKANKARWLCKCDCGNEKIVVGGDLQSGRTRSCGCLVKTHGLRNSTIYKIWVGIKTRCYNPNSNNYNRYGARGIKMFAGWLDDFVAFFDYVSALENFGKPGYSIDRINNNGDYEPNNLRWTDLNTQCRNRRNNILVEYQGQEMTLVEAAEKSGINYHVLWQRYKTGERGNTLFRPARTNKKSDR